MNDENKMELITMKNNDGLTPLWLAVEHKRALITDRLDQLYGSFEIEADNNIYDLSVEKMFFIPSMQERAKTMGHVCSFMSKKLVEASETDDTELIRKLIADVTQCTDGRDEQGYSPLSIAISHNHVENVKLLLPHSHIFTDCNMIIIAIKHNSIDVIKYLFFDANVMMTKENFKGGTFKEKETVMNFCKTFLLFNKPDECLSLPLHYVAETGNVEIFKIIINFYQDVNCRNIHSQTPLHIAAAHKNDEIFLCLFRKSSYSLQLQDENGETPLSIACKNDMEESIKLVTKSIKMYTEPERRKFYLNLAIATHCEWLLNYVLDDQSDFFENYVEEVRHQKWDRGENLEFNRPFYDFDDNKWNSIENTVFQDNHAGLKLAIKNKFTDGVSIFMKNSDWQTLFRRQPSQNSNEKSPMQLLIEHMPDMAIALFEKCIIKKDSKIISHNFEFIDDVLYDTDGGTLESCCYDNTKNEEKLEEEESHDTQLENSPLSDFCCNGKYPLALMIRHKRYELLHHHFVDEYVDLKWNRFAKWGYYALCLYYMLFAIILTSLIIAAKPDPTNTKNEESSVNPIDNQHISVLESKKGLFNVSLSMILNPSFANLHGRHLKDGGESAETEYNTICIVSGFLVLILGCLHGTLLFLQQKYYRKFTCKRIWFDMVIIFLTLIAGFPFCQFLSHDNQWSVIVVINFLAWLNLLNYSKKHPRFGVYVIMIIEEILTFLRFAPIFVMFLMPFIVLFYVLFDNELGVFAFFNTFIHTLVMMIGEFDFADNVASKASIVTSSLFCLFLFTITIFLSNLLTGLAIDDITKIMKDAVLTRRIMQIETMHHVEKAMPIWLKNKYWKGFCANPIEIETIEKETHRFTSSKFRNLFKWFGLPKNAAKKLLSFENNENQMEVKLEKLEEKMSAILELLQKR